MWHICRPLLFFRLADGLTPEEQRADEPQILLFRLALRRSVLDFRSPLHHGLKEARLPLPIKTRYT